MAGPRVFSVEQANEQIPDLERIFAVTDTLRKKLQTSKIRLNALEMIWGEKLQESDCPDHGEFRHYVEELKSLEESLQGELGKIAALGGSVKGMDPALVDFYGVRDGFLVYLCWRRGEKAITHFHDLESGFSGRQPL